jgi:hypothetical protein
LPPLLLSINITPRIVADSRRVRPLRHEPPPLRERPYSFHRPIHVAISEQSAPRTVPAVQDRPRRPPPIPDDTVSKPMPPRCRRPPH